MKKIGKMLPFLVLVCMLAVVTVVGILQPEKTYSSVENRELQTFPKLSLKRIRNGKFQSKYEVYLSDQFPARDSWVTVQTQAQRLCGKRESNGVYFGKHGYLLEKYTDDDFDKKQLKKNRKALKKFVEKAGKKAQVHVMLVPSKTQILSADLPLFAESYDERDYYNQIAEELPEGVLVPVWEVLEEHKGEDIYYRTDHHWTTYGAWYAYEMYRELFPESAGMIPAEEKRALRVVSDDFLGTTHTKVNVQVTPDKMEVYDPKREMTVVYDLGERTEHTFYEEKFLDEKDKYSLFFGGNQAVIEINGGVENGRTLLIIKDSFANCMIPFLAEDFEKVIVADMRQLNADKSMLLDMFGPTDVLVLYNTVQFMQDKEFAMK